MAGQSVKVYANASAATPPAVYFAKTFTDCPASRYFWYLLFWIFSEIHTLLHFCGLSPGSATDHLGY
jgi:hypothetical protein